MKKILAIGLLAFVGCNSKKAPVVQNQETITVKAINIKKLKNTSTTQTIVATGIISTTNEARYAFKIGGVIEKILVSEGQSFKKGQLLATLNVTEINAQLEQAQLAYQKAERDYKRASNLYKDSVATLEQLQNAQTGLDIAKKTLEQVSFNQRYAYIYATAEGFVSKKVAHEGEVVAPGMPVLAINETTQSWTLKLGVSDQQWAAIQLNDKAKVFIDAFPGKAFEAEVYKKPMTADQASGSFEVELKLLNVNEPLALGMFAKAEINISTQSENTLIAIPYEALIEADGNKAFVFVPHENNRVKKIPVVIESFDKEKVLIKSGLENIETIITANSAFLNEQSVVSIQNENRLINHTSSNK